MNATLPPPSQETILLTAEAEAFIDAFERCALPPGSFRHRDHVWLAWLYLRLYPLPVALERYAEGLKRFAASIGQDGLYHETITYAFIFLINERMKRDGLADSWGVFAARNDDLLSEGIRFLHVYYRPETLASDLARKVFLMPEPQMEGAVAEG